MAWRAARRARGSSVVSAGCARFELGVSAFAHSAQAGVGAVGGFLRGWLVPPLVGRE